jgi:glycogen phosphorylase
VRRQHERRGESGGALRWTDEILDPDALTIGFARRFAEYKRGALLLRQPDRLRALLTSAERPVQLVFAGKAHPRDEIGKDIIRQLVHFSSDPQLRTRMVFVEDYDMELARLLYRGCDLWLNNPRRPYEACGTSGQKAVLTKAGRTIIDDFGGLQALMFDASSLRVGGVFPLSSDPERRFFDAELQVQFNRRF